MRTFKFLCVCICLAGPLAKAQERPTLLQTCDPRPDILPRPFYDNHTEYRAQYNRPRFYTGWLAYEVSRTSQEAMVWKENYCAGNYDQHHMPPVCKTYYYPKPWEMLTTGARPDFASSKPKTQRVPATKNSDEVEEVEDITKEESSKSTNNDGENASEDKSPADKSQGEDRASEIKADDKKLELVPSPTDKATTDKASTDKTSRKPTSKPRPVTTKPNTAKKAS